MIKIFFHVACMNYFGDVKNELIAAVRAACLEDAADEIHVNLAGKCRVLIDGKWRANVTRSDLSEFEFPTLGNLWDNAKPDDKILYIHTKGVSHTTEPAKTSCANWRRYMTWGVIERWRECVDALNENDLAGVLYVDSPRWGARCGSQQFFAGNFWWARGDYIKRLARPEANPNRWLAEGWAYGAAPRVKCLHNISGGREIGPGSFTFKGVSRSSYANIAAWHEGQKKIARRPRVRSRIEIINHLIKERGYTSYLEIGVENHKCFSKVECAHKVSVDPAANPPAKYPITSDLFFQESQEFFDIIFIDGLHTEDQVRRDIANALDRLNPGGVIIVHDCLPETELEQRDTPNYDRRGIWVGTVWREWARLRMTRPCLKMGVVDTDFGVGIIERGHQETYPTIKNLKYADLVKHRNKLMNVIEPEDFFTWI